MLCIKYVGSFFVWYCYSLWVLDGDNLEVVVVVLVDLMWDSLDVFFLSVWGFIGNILGCCYG